MVIEKVAYATVSLHPYILLFFFLSLFIVHCLQLYRPNGISPMGKLGLISTGKASFDRVALPNLRCMLDDLVFP